MVLGKSNFYTKKVWTVDDLLSMNMKEVFARGDIGGHRWIAVKDYSGEGWTVKIGSGNDFDIYQRGTRMAINRAKELLEGTTEFWNKYHE